MPPVINASWFMVRVKVMVDSLHNLKNNRLQAVIIILDVLPTGHSAERKNITKRMFGGLFLLTASVPLGF
jgi:hypothetical protein